MSSGVDMSGLNEPSLFMIHVGKPQTRRLNELVCKWELESWNPTSIYRNNMSHLTLKESLLLLYISRYLESSLLNAPNVRLHQFPILVPIK